MKIFVHVVVVIPFILLMTGFSKSQDSNPTIKYYRTGGFVGGTMGRITILPDGMAIDEDSYPNLHAIMSSGDYRSLLKLFHDFDGLKKDLGVSKVECMDAIDSYFILVRDSITTEIELSGCISFESDNSITKERREAINRLIEIRTRLDSIYTWVYNKEESWLGVIPTFSLDGVVVLPTDSIRVDVVLRNSESKDQKLYFPPWGRVAFSLDPVGPWDQRSYRHSRYPSNEEKPPIELRVPASDSVSFHEAWCCRDSEHSGLGHVNIVSWLRPGVYLLEPFVTAQCSRDTTHRAPFLIDYADTTAPVGGVVWADEKRNGDSALVDFRMRIQNWTNAPVRLDFEDSALFRIELVTRGDYRRKDSIVFVSLIGTPDELQSLVLSPKQIHE